MDKKYIVTNCPSFNEGNPNLDFFGECLDLTQTENVCCADCTNCLIKQVIEKCKEPEQVYRNNDKTLTQAQCNILFGRRVLGYEILQLFEIEEVNNDG